MTIVPTDDGSYTVHSSQFNATYHSLHGAIQESKHVFITHGLNAFLDSARSQLTILEMGFGTGLNALLTYIEFLRYPSLNLHYTSVDLFPLGEEEWKALNYADCLSPAGNYADIYAQIHRAPWNKDVQIHSRFIIRKLQLDFLSLPTNEGYDLMYYDAFGPGTQAELWDINACQRIAMLLAPFGRMTTYCAQGQFKRNLKAVGLHVHSLAGPPGKREMTVAEKQSE